MPKTSRRKSVHRATVNTESTTEALTRQFTQAITKRLRPIQPSVPNDTPSAPTVTIDLTDTPTPTHDTGASLTVDISESSTSGTEPSSSNDTNAPTDDFKRDEYTITIPMRRPTEGLPKDSNNSTKMFRTDCVFANPPETVQFQVGCHPDDPDFISVGSIFVIILYGVTHVFLIELLVFAWFEKYHCNYVHIDDVSSLIIFNDSLWGMISSSPDIVQLFLKTIIIPFREMFTSTPSKLRKFEKRLCASREYAEKHPTKRIVNYLYISTLKHKRYVRLPKFVWYDGKQMLTSERIVFESIQLVSFGKSKDAEYVNIFNIVHWFCSIDNENYVCRLARAVEYFITKNIESMKVTSAEAWCDFFADKEMFAYIWHDNPQYANIKTNPALVYLRKTGHIDRMHCRFDPTLFLDFITNKTVESVNKLIERANCELRLYHPNSTDILFEKISKRQRTE
jgi:hypothetical protein